MEEVRKESPVKFLKFNGPPIIGDKRSLRLMSLRERIIKILQKKWNIKPDGKFSKLWWKINAGLSLCLQVPDNKITL